MFVLIIASVFGQSEQPPRPPSYGERAAVGTDDIYSI